jgi:predicted nucleotidyltransferase
MADVLTATLAALREAEAALRERGVTSLAVTGSVARGTARPDSDLDVVVDLDPSRPLGVLALVDIRLCIESRVGRNVDVLERRALRSELRVLVERDAVPVF